MLTRKIVARLLVLLEYFEKKVYFKMTMKTPRSLEKRTSLSEAKGGGRFLAERDQFIQPTAFQVLCGRWDAADHQLGADADVRKLLFWEDVKSAA